MLIINYQYCLIFQFREVHVHLRVSCSWLHLLHSSAMKCIGVGAPTTARWPGGRPRASPAWSGGGAPPPPPPPPHPPPPPTYGGGGGVVAVDDGGLGGGVVALDDGGLRWRRRPRRRRPRPTALGIVIFKLKLK